MRVSVVCVLALAMGCTSAPTPSDGAGSDASSTVDAGADARPTGDTGTAPVDTGAPASDAGGPPLVRSTDFAEASGEIRNPDRGLYWLDWNEDSALVLVQFELIAQCGTATLPGSVVTALRNQLAGHRAGGRRAIVRFVYANDGDLNPCGLADAESMAIILGHLTQLAPVLAEYEDVIAFFQAGLFGMWGEWNQEHAPAGTSLSVMEANRDQLLNALLDAVPPRRSVEVRRPRFREELGGDSARLARIGFHDDCFLADATDMGTYDGSRSIAEWKTYLQTVTLTSPAGGESCQDTPTYTNCSHTIAEMELLRFSYMHEGYHADVVARWAREGCLEEIRARLGYRFVVRAVEAPTSIAPGENLRVHVEIENVGFAPPYDERRARLLLRDASGAATPIGAEVTLDLSAWLPGMHVLDLEAVVPASVAAGGYEVRLSLLEDASDLPAYAMLFANDSRVRDDARRENVIANVDVAP